MAKFSDNTVSSINHFKHGMKNMIAVSNTKIADKPNLEFSISKDNLPTAFYTYQNPDGSANYYLERHKQYIKKYHLEPPNYYLQYGYKNNFRFQDLKASLSQEGKKWVDQTSIELQRLMEVGLQSNPAMEHCNRTFQKFAYKTHVLAYIKNQDFYRLNWSDKIKIFCTPTYSHSFGSALGLQQIAYILLGQLYYNSFRKLTRY